MGVAEHGTKWKHSNLQKLEKEGRKGLDLVYNAGYFSGAVQIQISEQLCFL